MRLNLVLNGGAGSLRGLDAAAVADELADILRAHGHDVAVHVRPGAEALETIAEFCRGEAGDAVIVGGGDGTVSAAAALATSHGVTLGVLPLGTMNLFARSLGVPLDRAAAASALAGGEVAGVDIGEVNGRYFVHHVALGLHPRMIQVRERLSYASRLGKIWASGLALWMAVRRPLRLSVRIEADGEALERRTAALLISNNPLGEGHLPYADDLRQGCFGLYVARGRRWQDLSQLTARMLLGAAADGPLLESRRAERVEIRLERERVRASVDGEIVRLEAPLTFTLHRRKLNVLMPRTG